MQLRQKSIVIIGLTLFLLLLSIFLTADTLLHQGYNQLEKNYAEQNVKRAIKAIETEISVLENMVKYRVREADTFQFVQTGNSTYIAAHTADEVLSAQRLNIVMYTDSAGQVIYIRGFDWDKDREIPISQETVAKLAAIRPNVDAIYGGTSKGVIILPEGPMLVAAGTIARDNTAAQGELLYGRYITVAEQEVLSERVQLPLNIVSWHDELSPDFVAAQPYLYYSDEVYSKAVDADYMASYTVLPDITGEPALLMRVFMPRVVAKQVQQMLTYFVTLLSCAGVVFGGAMLILLERNVLNKLAQVSHTVQEIAKSKDMAIRLPDMGKDELANLANNINKMLEALETAQDKLSYVGRHDTLTGLYNRASFEEYLGRIKPLDDNIAIIVADVDGLKLINDTLGHTNGDELLRKAASVLQSACPQDAVIARIGGDEFAVLLKNYSSPEVAAICQDIKTTVNQSNLAATSITLSMSLGFAAAEGRPNDAAGLLREADNYMYRDKLMHSRSTRSAIVQTLKKALEARDFITDGHADRLQALVRLLGKEAGLLEARLAELQLFAQFHDIGKVGIPDGILFKPGRLTDEELTVMHSHAEIGYRIANSAPDLVFIADWILKHHEWWNGGGYPLGISGKDIPLECRILALADAYDAMTSSRPYRKPLSKEGAIAEIVKNAGIQFDPELTRLFAEILSKIPGDNLHSVS